MAWGRARDAKAEGEEHAGLMLRAKGTRLSCWGQGGGCARLKLRVKGTRC